MPFTTWVRALPQLPAVTAVLFLCGSAGLLVNVAFPAEGKNPPAVLAVLGVVSFCFGVYAAVRGVRFTQSEAVVMLVPLLAVVTALSITTDLDVAALGNGLALPAIGAYVVWFVPGRVARTLYVLGVLAWFAALLARDAGLGALGFTVLLECLVAVEVLRRLRDRLASLSVTDPLTGALNVRGVRDEAQRLVRRGQRYGKPLSVVVIDLDDLREVNNTYGHAAGDFVLESVCDHWRANLRGNDVLGRTGGDEFVMLLPDTTAERAQTLVAGIEETSPAAWSWGVATLRDGDSLDSVLKRADERMYVRKDGRRQR